jgi:serine/threonine protein kinase
MSFLSGIVDWGKRVLSKRTFKQSNNRNRINFSTLRNKNFKNVDLPIGIGAFGTTFKIHKDPNGLFKVLFRRKNAPKPNPNTNYNKAKKMANMTGNNNQRLQIITGFKMNDLPIKVMQRFQEIDEVWKTEGNTNLPVIRMPYLGIDLYAALNEDNIELVRALSISTIMIQCHELIRQIDVIRRHKMCHGDIKMDNIVIDPKSGKMTLIDFDFFETFIDVYTLYNKIIVRNMQKKDKDIPQCIPPEFLCMKAMGDGIDFNNDIRINPFYEKYCDNTNMDVFLTYIGKDGKKYFKESFKNNKKYISPMFFLITENGGNTVRNANISDNIMNYFDFFGFGIAMTLFFSRLYPINEPIYKNKSERDAYHKMRTLLMNMCDFSIENRPRPDNVLEEMEQIMKKIPKEARQERSIFKAVRQASNNSIVTSIAPSIPNVTSRVSNNSKATSQTAKKRK